MNIKKFIYQFLGFAIFYIIAGLLFGLESRVICIVAGLIGSFVGKFISKVNGFFAREIVWQHIVNKRGDIVDVEFTLKADYKTKPIILFGYYSANSIIDTQTLFNLLYNRFYDYNYMQLLKNGTVKIKVGLKGGWVEIEIQEDSKSDLPDFE